MYPRVLIDPKKYAYNVSFITDLCHKQGISIMGVSKVYCADEKLVSVLDQSQVDFIADSKLDNLMHIKTIKPKVYLRIPALSEASLVVKFTDMSLHSELEVIKKIDEISGKMRKRHKIILMYDLGDLREGIYYQSFKLDDIKEVLALQHIDLYGIGTNLTCYGSVIPSIETYQKLKTIKDQIENAFDIKLHLISGGNSSSIPMLIEGSIPDFINNLRIGEAMIVGRETAYQKRIDHLYEDVITLETEILEIKEKPSYPEGELGFDAFGQIQTYKDVGMMKRAILSIGRQDVKHDDLIPPKGIEIVGSSSDHLIVHIIDGIYQIGDVIQFKLKYGGILSLMTSPYVEKVYV
jgi:predicted amino acid racemase